MIYIKAGAEFVYAFVALALFGAYATGPVPRARLLRFARRADLEITAGNGQPLVVYLATTRRWRAAGMISGFALAIAVEIDRSSWLGDPVTLVVAGWFIGTLIAEVRLSDGSRSTGGTRVVSMRSRGQDRYIGTSARLAAPLAVIASLGLFAADVANGTAAATHPVRQVASAAGPAIAVLAILALILCFRSLIARRPQTIDNHEGLVADEAIRSRSMHKVTGGGFALAALCISEQVTRLSAPAGHGDGALASPSELGRLVILIGVLLGIRIATAPFAVPSRPVSVTVDLPATVNQP